MTKKSHGTNTYCIGVENGIWAKETCREAEDSFNGLRRESVLDRHVSVYGWTGQLQSN